MTTKRIIDLPELSAADANDFLVLEDVSAGATKKIKVQNVQASPTPRALLCFGAATTAGAGTEWCHVGGAAGAARASVIETVVPFACTLDRVDVYAQNTGNAPGGASSTWTVYVNGISFGPAASIIATNTAGGQTSSGPTVLSAGDRVSVQITYTGAFVSAPTDVVVSCRLTLT